MAFPLHIPFSGSLSSQYIQRSGINLLGNPITISRNAPSSKGVLVNRKSLSCICSSSNTMVEVKRERKNNKIPHVLSVAGSDSGAGAGIQADMKACGALGVYCSTVITALTAQNTVGVQGVHLVPEDFVYEQLRSVLSDMQVDVVKTGMLPSTDIIQALCRILREYRVQALVVDPVMVATSGDVLASPAILDVLRYVLVKGGHLQSVGDVIDILYDGETYHELCGPRIETRNTHGTGCSLASCIAAELAKGSQMLPAVLAAKRFIEEALEYSQGFLIGNGPQGPFNHLFKFTDPKTSPTKRRFNPNDLLLYAVTDSGMNKKWGRSISQAVNAAIEGGATIVQLREKEAETKEIINAAEECLKFSRSHGVPLLINDRVDVALACNADGVHLGQSDMPVKVARALLGPSKIIGASCKTPEQAQKAWEEGADYIGSGGVYPTNTKKNNQTIGLTGLQGVCESSPLPVVAIGGINAENAHEVMEMHLPKLKGVAVVSCLFDRHNIAEETHKFCSSLAKYADTEN